MENKEIFKLNNIFYSVQGEGIHIGKPTIFVRFAGCPFRCPYCDEPAALTEKGSFEREVDGLYEIIDREFLRKYNFSYVEFTGGSPEIQNNKMLYNLCKKLKRKYIGLKIGMQMSGGIEIHKKLWEIIDNHKIDYKEPACNIPFIIDINKLTSQDEIKFVVDNDNFDWFVEEVKRFEYSNVNIIVSPKSSAYSNEMLELENAKELTMRILNARLGLNIQVLPRLQQLYWCNKKGV